MIHPTRTNLLFLKEKRCSVLSSTAILKARRQALIRELLATTAPFIASRGAVQATYAGAIQELAVSCGIEGEEFVNSIAAVAPKDLGVELQEESVMGLRYLEVRPSRSPLRPPGERGYDERGTTSSLEAALHHFEEVVAAMLEIAAFESKLKRLAAEVVRVTRRIRVLEERVMPELTRQVRTIAQFLGEREREASFRLKRFREVKGSGPG